jgi:cytosine permease
MPKQNKQAFDAKKGVMAATEYAFEPVPDDAKKTAISLIAVLAGYLIAMSNFVTGAAIGYKTTFADALISLIVSDLYLVAICLTCGSIAFKFRQTTTVIARKVFGQQGSLFLSVVLALSVVCWVGTNGDTFAKMILAAFSGWPIPITITAVILIFVWLQSAARGYRGLEFISFWGVPAAIILSIWVIASIVFSHANLSNGSQYIPTGDYTFAQATTAGVGSWIFGAIASMDVIRFAKKKSHFLIGGFISFFLCLLILQLTGVVCAQATGKSNFVTAAAGLGIALPTLVCSFFALWTTQDNNIYSATMSVQNILNETPFKGKIAHKHIAYGLAILAALFSVTGALNYILIFVSTLSVLLAPIPGLYVAEVYVIKANNDKFHYNIWGLAAWLIAGVSGWYCNANSILVPPIISFCVALAAYIILGRVFAKKEEIATNGPNTGD